MKVLFRRTLVLTCLALLMGPAALAASPLPAAVEGEELPSLAPMLGRVQPTVVITPPSGRLRVPENPLFQDPSFRRFFGLPQQPRERRTPSLGSGVIVDADNGYILTNHHVIQRADELTVTLNAGREID